jgi:NADPH:quinone reductase
MSERSATVPTMMAAVEIAGPGGPDMLRWVERPVPQPGPGEVLLKVEAAGVNRPDIVQRMGLYPPPPGASDLPGLEAAGEIVALGAGVDASSWRLGDKATALLAGGGYAAYATAPIGQCLPIPNGLHVQAAASLPETVLTVWANLAERAALRAGESVLVHGGTSGIGVMAIQIAKAMGCLVLTTAKGAAKTAACRELGADWAIDYACEDFAAAVITATQGRGVDVVLDMVGGDYVQRNLDCMAMDGRHVSIAFLQGAKVSLNMAPVMLKRLTLTGSTLRARSLAEKARLTEAVRQHVWPMIEAGKVRPVIHAAFPLAQAEAAHRLMEASGHIGKIMLLP